MLSIHIIKTVAKYEMRTLLRGWFFRIFAALAVFSLGIFNIAVFLEASGAPWLYRALPASIPYANLIILNLGQAIVAVFLASEFLKQDKKNDTVEVIYARSMTNAEYILGKALGVLAVFLVLNVIILCLGIGFSFLSSDSSRAVLTYFYYPLLVSLPTLVYILGLSFFLMITIKNQAITFILLLGYIALSIFYLNTKFYHLLDFIAYNVPMMHSTIGGFGNIKEILLHRGIYFFLGTGFVFFTVFRLSRLPQAKVLKSLPLYLAILFAGLGFFSMKKYLDLKRGTIVKKQELIEVNNKYVNYARIYVDSSQISLEHKEDKLIVAVNLSVINKNNQQIDTLIFSLNPQLVVSSALINNEEAKFERELQIVKLIPKKKISSGEKLKISLNYQGTIDENTHFLDQNLENYEDNFSFEMFRLRKRYAYLNKDFVCLTSESLWYPVAGVGHASVKPTLHLPDFTNFTLKVQTENGLVAVSQGKLDNSVPGVFKFQPEYPLPKISLLIANYKKYTLNVDSLEYNLYIKQGNEYFEEHFAAFTDSIPHLIRELRNEYETFIGLHYPFNRFTLAEVPIHFALDKHLWSVSSDAVQPEITFALEKGVMMEETDFKKRRNREEKRMKRNNEEVLPEELQARIFKRFVRGNFMATPKEWYHADVVDRNTFVLFPQYYTFITQLNSKEWSLLNIALEAYLKERNVSDEANSRWWREGINKGERVNMELKQASLTKIIDDGIETTEDEDERVSLNDVIQAKGTYLFSLFRGRYGEKRFNETLNKFVNNNQHRSFSFSELDSLFLSVFGNSIESDLKDWLNKRQLPGFLVKDIQNYKVKEGEFIKYQVRFKVSNPEKVDGLITVFVEMNDENRRGNREFGDLDDVGFSKKIVIPAGKAKEVGLVFTSEPARMRIFTHISENLPNNLNYDFSSFEETKRVPPLDSIVDLPLFTTLQESKEIIVDNEDDGFKVEEVSNQSYLKSLVKNGSTQRYRYTPIRFWDPPGSWKSVIRTEFYGKYARSAEFTKTGDGNRKAIWAAPIKEAGYFDIYAHIVNIDFGRHSDKEKLNYNFKVFHTDGFDEINLYENEIESGWNYLGTFYISPSTAKVELSNKSSGKMLFADAIKWVKSK